MPAPLKKPADFKIIGQSLPRKDLPGKVFGTLEMVNDVRLPGMLHARMMRPTVAGAVPVKVDEASIKHIPGAKVVWIKDLLAVVAEKEWNAVKAARALKVTWSDSKPNFPEHDKLFEHIRKAPIVRRHFQRENGKFEEGIKQAVRVIEGEYEFPTQSHSSMGPACAVADVRDGEATIWTSTQKPYDSAYCVAELLGLPQEKVRAIWMFGTGSYGRNEQGDATADAAVLSKHLGRPVRVQYMRHEGLAWDPKGTASINRSRAGLDANGKVIAYENISKAFSRLDNNTRETRAADVLAGQLLGLPLNAGQSFEIPVASYTFDHGRLGWEIIPPLMERASPLRSTHLRDPYGPPILFGSESFIDEMAAATNTDPVDFRLQYLKHPRDRDAVRIAAESFGWDKRPSPRNDQKGAEVAVGRGIAFRRHFTTFIGLVAEVRVHRKTGKTRHPALRLCPRHRHDRQSGDAQARDRPPAGLRHQPGDVRGGALRPEHGHQRGLGELSGHAHGRHSGEDRDRADRAAGGGALGRRRDGAWASCRRRSAMRCSTPPACGCAGCRSRPSG